MSVHATDPAARHEAAARLRALAAAMAPYWMTTAADLYELAECMADTDGDPDPAWTPAARALLAPALQA